MTEEENELLRRLEEKKREIDYMISHSEDGRKDIVEVIEDMYIQDFAEVLAEENAVFRCKVHLRDLARKIKKLNK